MNVCYLRVHGLVMPWTLRIGLVQSFASEQTPPISIGFCDSDMLENLSPPQHALCDGAQVCRRNAKDQCTFHWSCFKDV